MSYSPECLSLCDSQGLILLPKSLTRQSWNADPPGNDQRIILFFGCADPYGRAVEQTYGPGAVRVVWVSVVVSWELGLGYPAAFVGDDRVGACLAGPDGQSCDGHR